MGKVRKNFLHTVTRLFAPKAKSAFYRAPDPNYEMHIAVNPPKRCPEDFQVTPRISIVATGDDKEVKNSLAAQTYKKWELISDAKSFTGEYIMFLPQGARLTNDALSCFVNAINMEKRAEVIYADEDRLGHDQKRVDPIFKPDYNEVTALSYNSMGLPLLVSRRVYESIGKPPGKDAASQYQYALMCAACCDRVLHIPRVLLSLGGKRETADLGGGMEAIRAYLERRGRGAQIEPGLYEGTFRVIFGVKKRISVGIIIRDNAGVDNVRRLLENIEENTTYRDYKIVIANGGAADERTRLYYDKLKKHKAAKIVYGETCNDASLCNLGAKDSDCDVLLFLGSDMEMITPDYIEAMLDVAQQPDIGAVGAKLIDEGGRILHCGEVIGLLGFSGSLYAGDTDDGLEIVRNGFVNVQRSVSAVSGDCLMVAKDKFLSVGGFDEGFASMGADVEFCLRLMQRGFTNVFTPYAVMVNRGAKKEWPSAPQGDKMKAYDAIKMMLFKGDPNYNPNYDYAMIVPRVAINPYPAIELNENYRKK